MKAMHWVAMVVVMAGAAAFSGCENKAEVAKDECGGKSKCSAEPADSAEEIAACVKSTKDPKCGAAALANLKCQSKNEVCTADNKTDKAKTDAACAAEAKALAACTGAAAAP